MYFKSLATVSPSSRVAASSVSRRPLEKSCARARSSSAISAATAASRARRCDSKSGASAAAIGGLRRAAAGRGTDGSGYAGSGGLFPSREKRFRSRRANPYGSEGSSFSEEEDEEEEEDEDPDVDADDDDAAEEEDRRRRCRPLPPFFFFLSRFPFLRFFFFPSTSSEGRATNVLRGAGACPAQATMGTAADGCRSAGAPTKRPTPVAPHGATPTGLPPSTASPPSRLLVVAVAPAGSEAEAPVAVAAMCGRERASASSD